MLYRPLSILSILLTLTAFCVPVASETTAFVGVNVIPMDTAGTLSDHTVIVEDGRIAAVGPRDSTPVPDGATRIEGAGKYLIPGLTDVHVHLPEKGFMSALLGEEVELQPIENMLYLYVAAGVTTVRVMSGFPALLELRDAIAKGEVLGPRLIVCTPMFDGAKPIWPAPFSRAISSADEARAAVIESKEMGYDMIKVYSALRRDAYDAMMEQADTSGLKVVGHVPVWVGLEHALASGQDEITHGEEYWRFTRDFSDEVVARFTKMTVDAGTWFSPTITTYQNIQDQIFDVEAVLNRPEVRYIDPVVRKFWAPPHNRYLGANEHPEKNAEAAKSFQPKLDFMRRLVKSLYEAGVPIVTGTDALNPMSMPGYAVHDELAELVGVGLPPWEALRASTVRPAEFMDASGEWGVVAVGRMADLVLLSANPLEDIGHVREIEGVMRRGRWLPRTEIQDQLDGFASQYAGE